MKLGTHHGPATICIKDRSRLPEGGNEAQRAEAYERAQETWWADAAEAALELGFADVFSHGRSGGYIGPVYSDRRTPDMDDDSEREAVEKFAQWCADNTTPAAIAERFALELAECIDSEPEATPTPAPDICAAFLAHCINRSETAAASDAREFWRRLAGSVRKASAMP